MEHLVIVLSILSVLATCYATQLPGEVYWNNVLPKTPMPKIIETLLMNTDRLYAQSHSNAAEKTEVISNNQIVLSKTAKTTEPFRFNAWPQYKAPKTTAVNTDSEPFRFNAWPQYKAAKTTAVHTDSITTLFFTEEKLWSGDKMTLSLLDPSAYNVTFFSRKAAKSTPFAYSKLSEILNHFSVKPNSLMGEAIKSTLINCEEPSGEGEIKSCPTSLESLVEFCTATLGTRAIVAKSTTADRQNLPKQQYEIISFSKKNSKPDMVLCHALYYVHAVFYCHKLRGVEAYEVSMVGKDGTKVDAVAACHKDTSWWNPNHIAFQVLGVKPGTVPICHVLPQYDIIWAPKN